MDKLISMPVGIVVERRELQNRWQKVAWKPIGVLPGAGLIEAKKVLLRGEGWAHFHMATLPLELHRKETLAYKTNLNDRSPRLYVVLRTIDEPAAEDEIVPFLVTASPFQAQDYLDSGNDIVEGVTMPDAIIAWIGAFCDHHHVDEPFKKRKRKRYDPNEVGFGRRPDGLDAKRPGSGGGNGGT
ncbi:MAG: DUF3305 domain-containing protein [Alphaproteobacteria bacterium]|nr:DUF3305 domain-containing protein [Alphaproteobacteria bacterium]